jgi:gliding motility-associated-like protein
MKLRYSVIFVLFGFLSPFMATSQSLPPLQPEQDACNALVLCGNSFFTPYSYQGLGTINDLPNTPCSGGEANSMWLRLNVATPGSIVFTITPVLANDDYDFAVVDITNSSCSTMTFANVIRCNFNNNFPGSNVNGIVGVSSTGTLQYVTAGATGNSFCSQINAVAGNVILIMVNDFGDYITSAPSQGFTIDFTGSTATFNVGTPSMDYVIPSCNNSQQVTLQMNTNVKCNSIAPNGSDFAVSGGGAVSGAIGNNCVSVNGYTDKITLNFAAPLPAGTYTLSVQTGSDNNTILDLCNTPIAVGDTVQFYIPPYQSPSFVSVASPACKDFKIKLNTRVRCDSIAKNGSDFFITGPQSSSIVAAYGIGCDTTNFTDSILLILQDPLQTDGVYTITAKKGTDNNTIMDSCGLIQLVGDAISVTINSYDGQIVSIPDEVLCNPKYILLQATNNAVPPLVPVNCDATNNTCGANTMVAFLGTKDSSSDVNTPFLGSAHDQRAQYLYRASELRGMGLNAGKIQTLQWKVTQKLSNLPYSNFTIKIGCTSLSDLGTTFLTVNDVVYTDPAYTPVAGWNTFQLTTPYNWDGVSNLVVEVCYDNAGASFNDKVAHSQTIFSSVTKRYGNSLSGCSIINQGTIVTSTFRPRLRLYICEPVSGPPNYTWSPGTFVSDSTIAQPLAFINNDQTYNVTTIDRYGCAHRDSTSFILSIRHVDVMPKDTTICFGVKVKLEASGGLTYAWNSVNPSTISCLNCASTIVNPPVTTTYSVVLNDQYNCADTLYSTVNVNQLPFVDILTSDTTVKYGTTIRLNGTGAYLYNWYPAGALSDPNVQSPFLEVTRPVTIILTGIDANGCRNTDSVHINVDYTDPFFIPSGFTPNGDGKNDVFKVGSISFQKLLEFRVFNRWGQEVFTTTDPQKGWDGTFKGVPQEVGAYQYLVRIAFPDGKVYSYKGDVTLLR